VVCSVLFFLAWCFVADYCMACPDGLLNLLLREITVEQQMWLVVDPRCWTSWNECV